jgi:phospholipid-binding lipoprotein MlaA
LPIFGPSTPRAAVGLAGDLAAEPLTWGPYYLQFSHDAERYAFYYGLSALGFVSLREKNLELLDNLTANSVDAYTTIKSAYMQNRLKLNVCADKNAEPASYDFDFDEEFEDE